MGAEIANIPPHANHPPPGRKIPVATIILITFAKGRENIETVQLEVFGLVDHAHPAATELAQDAVVLVRLANHRAEILRSRVNEESAFAQMFFPYGSTPRADSY